MLVISLYFTFHNDKLTTAVHTSKVDVVVVMITFIRLCRNGAQKIS